MQRSQWQADTIQELKALDLKGQRMQHAAIGQPHFHSPLQCAMGQAWWHTFECCLPEVDSASACTALPYWWLCVLCNTTALVSFTKLRL